MDPGQPGGVSHRILARIPASLVLPGSRPRQVELRRFDAVGFDIILRGDPAIRPDSLSPGQAATLELRIPGQDSIGCPSRIRTIESGAGGLVFRLTRDDLRPPRGFQAAGSGMRSVLLRPEIRARIRHPFLFGCSPRVILAEFHRDFHWVLSVREPGLLILPGMFLNLEIALPGVNPQAVLARVDFVEKPDAAGFRFGVRCLSMSFPCNQALGGHLMSEHRWTPADLRRAGFRVRSMEDQFRFGTASSAEEYAEVLALRRDAYVRVGKRSTGTTADQMAGALDSRSRILTVRHHGRLVGSMAFAFPPDEATVTDCQRGFPGDVYPDYLPLPPKRQIVEIARLCVADEYRGTDFVPRLFAEGFKQFMLTDRRWLLTSCTRDLLPFYREIGFRSLGAVYRHHLFNGKEHHLILLDKQDVTWKPGTGIIAWIRWFGDVAAYLQEQGLLDLPAWVGAAIRLKLTARPLVKWLDARKEIREFAAHFRSRSQRTDLWRASHPSIRDVSPVAAGERIPTPATRPIFHGKHGRHPTSQSIPRIPWGR